MKELGPTRQIVSLSNTKPILCDKAFFYLDPIFVNRLKDVSPSLASVGRRLPTQTEFETAAFVRQDLSVDIPLLDLDLHRAKVERRIRPLTANEPINPARLTIDPELLPPVIPHDPPDVNEVTQLVDAFFAQLQWTEPGVPTGSDEVTGADGRSHLTREGEEGLPMSEGPLAEAAPARSADDLSEERDS